MSRKQTRRGISVRGTTYARLRAYCDAHRLSMSEFVEQRIAEALGDPATLDAVVTKHLARPEPRQQAAAAPQAVAATQEKLVGPPAPASRPTRREVIARNVAERGESKGKPPGAPGAPPEKVNRAWNAMPPKAEAASPVALGEKVTAPPAPAALPAPTPAAAVIPKRPLERFW